MAFPQSKQNLVPTLMSVLVTFGSMTKVMYDTVKVIHHSPPGALICLFVFHGGAKLLSLDVWDVYDSCAGSFIFRLISKVRTLNVTP